MSAEDRLLAIRDEIAPRAPGMIVTIYGDLVMPNGGVLGMSALIGLCSKLGFSETLVRTAVSRLVAAGRLQGVRQGRKSYYRLTAAAEEEFMAVACQLHGPMEPPSGWAIHMAPSLPEPIARENHFSRLSGDLFLSPDRGHFPKDVELSFTVGAISDTTQLPALARSLWPVDELADGYAAMINRFLPLRDRAASLPAEEALLARLLLVHAYRTLLLRDPQLPADGLPSDWPGGEARGLFEEMHSHLSTAAKPAVKLCFSDVAEPA
ncbi:PaaX family transcriptional regulator C-terminal domain-containing protein [Notoacmeibacter ruber]|uniref:PaaX family transcriptional regulator n=1 Tax=Notoacmeibacter ruber TaxID=2670375 RepID=A0A3L7JJY3_9HYPH|nr:PaaX family transcriptional regulator C-terminal domain-containing protein [Notoacmeibacter ruber]RLQ88792.1 PaaX family transcriptional regulator [Notoacmeibacter ruber]